MSLDRIRRRFILGIGLLLSLGANACSKDDGDSLFDGSGAGGSPADGATSGGAAPTSGGMRVTGQSGDGSANGGRSTATSDPCDPDPCVHGVCRSNGDARCACDTGYEGSHCETETNECRSEPCLNGGECLDGPGRYACQCPPGFSGEICEVEVNGCEDEPCLNDGLCHDTADGYSCECEDGYRGDNCAIDIDECAATPCKNGGTCVDDVAGYVCRCALGYGGPNCDEVDACAQNPCQHGQCVITDDGQSCDCDAGWSGDHCDTEQEPCETGALTCENGGTCVTTDDGSACDCPASHTGTRCELPRFEGFGLLGEASSSTALDVSRDGTVVIGESLGESWEPVRRAGAGALEALDLGATPQASECHVFRADGDGQTVVGYCSTEAGNRPVHYKPASAYVSMSPLDYTTGYVRDVSADGTTEIGNFSDWDAGFDQAFRRTAQGTESIGPRTDGEDSYALAVNGNGSVVIGETLTEIEGAPALVGWRWAEGSTDVTELPFHETWGVPTLSDVSTDGNVVVGSVYVDGTFHAVRWLFPGGTAEVLGPGVLHGTNADGHIAVGALNGEAAIWVGDEPPQVIAELLAATANLENWSLGAALAVSDDGKTIVGEGLHGSTTEGWVARLP